MSKHTTHTQANVQNQTQATNQAKQPGKNELENFKDIAQMLSTNKASLSTTQISQNATMTPVWEPMDSPCCEDFRGQTFEGQNLYKAEYIECNLTGVNFKQANLMDANLSRNNRFERCDFQYANLQNATLSGSHFQHANFSGTNLQNAFLVGANLFHAYYNEETVFPDGFNPAAAAMFLDYRYKAFPQGQNLEGIRGHISFEGASLQQANLQNAYLPESCMMKTDLRGAHLENANLSMANLQEAQLQEANLKMANLCNANLKNTDLTQTQLQGAQYNQHTQFPENFDPTQAGMHPQPNTPEMMLA